MRKTCKSLFVLQARYRRFRGQWKYFKTREEAREHLYKHKIPGTICKTMKSSFEPFLALYEDGEPIEAYPLNRFAEPQKGLPVSRFFISVFLSKFRVTHSMKDATIELGF